MTQAVAPNGAIELVLFDLDGTLLDPARDIRPANLEAIAALRQRGIRVGVATGRSPRSARPYVERIAATGPLILFNGAMVWDVESGSAIHADALPQDDAIRAIEVAEAAGVHVNAYIGDELWIARMSATAARSAVKDGLEPIIVGDLSTRIRDQDAAVIKLMIVDERDPVMRLEAPIRAVIEAPLTLVNSEPEYLEVLASGVTKGSALLHIERFSGIARQRVVAFGDRLNDVELLRLAGVGVAMGNGHERAREVADIVIGNNDSDAIAEFLRGHL